MRILAVDDDQTVLDTLDVILSHDGLKSYRFTSPLAALRWTRTQTPEIDCILLDIMMPELDGISLCQEIRANSSYRETPVIMLTARAEWESIKRAFDAGATDFLSKPFDIYEVSARIRAASMLDCEKNKIEALRRRAILENRRLNNTYHSDKNKCRDENRIRQSKENLSDLKNVNSEMNSGILPTRAELVQLFSEDFSNLGFLKQRRSGT